MVVRSRPPSSAARDGTVGIPAPVRTCIGCRHRATAAELLRVVVASAAPDSAPLEPMVVVDPRRRAPGRGAWVHPNLRCVEIAQRRRAFARALRVPAAHSDAVRDFVSGLVAADGQQDQHINQGGTPPGSSAEVSDRHMGTR